MQAIQHIKDIQVKDNDQCSGEKEIERNNKIKG